MCECGRGSEREQEREGTRELAKEREISVVFHLDPVFHNTVISTSPGYTHS